MNKLPARLPNLPRYTSYPTAPHFKRHHAPAAAESITQAIGLSEPVSVYLHIPYCDRLCWFCACHTKHTLKYDPVRRYVDVLVREIENFSANLSFRPKLSRLHLGGGSPSMLKPAEARQIRTAIDAAFDCCVDAETSIELDPNDGIQTILESAMTLRMTRASLGIQDFDPMVQTAINRPQSFEETARLISALRHEGINSLNVDALYGLPCQTLASIDKTIEQVLSLEPDRIALFGYAHVPSVKKHQRMIDSHALPGDEERLAQSHHARKVILGGDYQPIGIDHFAKHHDELAVAAKEGRLRRNFQGYTADNAPVLLGFGASAISCSNSAYLQNTVAIADYMRRVEQGSQPFDRGLTLSVDDQVRAFIIQSLMCSFGVDFSEIEKQFGSSASDYLPEIEQVAQQNEYGLVTFDGRKLEMLPEKRDYVRLVAARFDAYLSSGASQYSKAV